MKCVKNNPAGKGEAFGMRRGKGVLKWDLEGLDGEEERADERVTDKRVIDGFVAPEKRNQNQGETNNIRYTVRHDSVRKWDSGRSFEF